MQVISPESFCGLGFREQLKNGDEYFLCALRCLYWGPSCTASSRTESCRAGQPLLWNSLLTNVKRSKVETETTMMRLTRITKIQRLNLQTTTVEIFLQRRLLQTPPKVYILLKKSKHKIDQLYFLVYCILQEQI